MSAIISFLRPWMPFVLTLAAGVLVWFFVYWLLLQRNSRLLGEQKAWRQFFLLLIAGTALIATIIVLPVESDVRSQLLSFTGLLISAMFALSSPTFITNAMAGLMLRALRAVRMGDFVRVGEYFGRISELGFLHTEIQNEDRSLTTLPNMYLVTNAVNVIRSSGTIVSADVSLGYDIHHNRVEAALLQAIEAAKLEDGFVQILELRDFSVVYRAAGMLTDTKALLRTRSRLRKTMLDSLHADGIEIVSPTFMNQRPLAARQRFVPQDTPQDKDTHASGTDIPESLIFDKAEEAETAEEMRTRMRKLEKWLEELREEKSKSEQQLKLIERAEKQLDSLHEKLENSGASAD